MPHTDPALNADYAFEWQDVETPADAVFQALGAASSKPSDGSGVAASSSPTERSALWRWPEHTHFDGSGA